MASGPAQCGAGFHGMQCIRYAEHIHEIARY
jgi:hypothetical protein